MNVVKPVVGQWYRGGTNELFEVVAIDDEDETIEIQYFDGTVTEIEFDAWNEQLLDELIDAADAPEDWSGAIDVEASDGTKAHLATGDMAFLEDTTGKGHKTIEEGASSVFLRVPADFDIKAWARGE